MSWRKLTALTVGEPAQAKKTALHHRGVLWTRAKSLRQIAGRPEDGVANLIRRCEMR
jgi:hypothetical protein